MVFKLSHIIWNHLEDSKKNLFLGMDLMQKLFFLSLSNDSMFSQVQGTWPRSVFLKLEYQK